MSSQSAIVTSSISSVEDRRLGMLGSSIVRRHGKGNSWNVLRIGIRYQLKGTGATIKDPAINFFMGLCSGVTAPFGTKTPTNCFGLRYKPTYWPFNAAGGANMACYQNVNLVEPGYSAKDIGGTLTETSFTITGGTNWIWPADVTAATRRCLFVDIVKGSPNYALNILYCKSATAAPDISASDFSSLVQTTTPSESNHSFLTNKGAVAFDQSAGELDCINLQWTGIYAQLHICDLAVVVIS